ncbi:chemotaxis protein CheX [Gemmatimonas groenlandica]|uniref:Chemotaxis protein CheX n=1 Tax=Gemmatimonas groenlandica TaxID=2732249 RepID=A0A6M4IRD1_9BACT|nr:chemotaxis protein CheX [Gemmatimonas groenlandica]QJR35956.1 chemotaxis protein CheX [Gemmatimonas groenlandica]
MSHDAAPVGLHDAVESSIVDLFDTMLGLPIRPSSVLPFSASETSSYTGVVAFDGAWSGMITVQMTPSIARACALTLMNVRGEDLTYDDIVVVVGEIANMIGGNLKSVLVAPATLSLPWVVDGKEFRIGMPDRQELALCAFECVGSQVHVGVFRRDVRVLAA